MGEAIQASMSIRRSSSASLLKDIFPEEEFLFSASIPLMCSFHVFVNFRQRHVEVDTKTEDRPTEKNNKDCESGIFKVGKLHFHASEFDTPAYGSSWRWRLEPHSLPIGRLDVLILL